MNDSSSTAADGSDQDSKRPDIQNDHVDQAPAGNPSGSEHVEGATTVSDTTGVGGPVDDQDHELHPDRGTGYEYAPGFEPTADPARDPFRGGPSDALPDPTAAADAAERRQRLAEDPDLNAGR